MTTPQQPDSPQLNRLAQRIPARFIERSPQGQAYAAHHVVNQCLLLIVGPFSFEQVQLHRGDVLERNKSTGVPSFSDDHSKIVLRNVVVAATYRLTAEVDGRRVVIEETGDVEQPSNWQHDGARIKDAESDALKRCAMRLGLGLELWADKLYILDKWLPTKDPEDDTGSPEASSGVEPQERREGGGSADAAASNTRRQVDAPAGPAPDDNTVPVPVPEWAQQQRAEAARRNGRQQAAAKPAPAADTPETPEPAPTSASNGASDENGLKPHPSTLLKLRRAREQGKLGEDFPELASVDDIRALTGAHLKAAREVLGVAS